MKINEISTSFAEYARAMNEALAMAQSCVDDGELQKACDLMAQMSTTQMRMSLRMQEITTKMEVDRG
jgi:hypothetical protein